MRENEQLNLEQDSRFPSGAWSGYFLQCWLPGRHTTNMTLTCQDGKLSGSGMDWVGPYTVEGNYDVNTGKCEWIKRYLGKHSVSYQGINSGNGIWGVWEIKVLRGLYVDHGGFHIWPQGLDVSQESKEIEADILAAMRKYRMGCFAGLIQLMMTLLILSALIFGLFALFRRESF